MIIVCVKIFIVHTGKNTRYCIYIWLFCCISMALIVLEITIILCNSQPTKPDTSRTINENIVKYHVKNYCLHQNFNFLKHTARKPLFGGNQRH